MQKSTFSTGIWLKKFHRYRRLRRIAAERAVLTALSRTSDLPDSALTGNQLLKGVAHV